MEARRGTESCTYHVRGENVIDEVEEGREVVIGEVEDSRSEVKLVCKLAESEKVEGVCAKNNEQTTSGNVYLRIAEEKHWLCERFAVNEHQP